MHECYITVTSSNETTFKSKVFADKSGDVCVFTAVVDNPNLVMKVWG